MLKFNFTNNRIIFALLFFLIFFATVTLSNTHIEAMQMDSPRLNTANENTSSPSFLYQNYDYRSKYGTVFCFDSCKNKSQKILSTPLKSNVYIRGATVDHGTKLIYGLYSPSQEYLSEFTNGIFILNLRTSKSTVLYSTNHGEWLGPFLTSLDGGKIYFVCFNKTDNKINHKIKSIEIKSGMEREQATWPSYMKGVPNILAITNWNKNSIIFSSETEGFVNSFALIDSELSNWSLILNVKGKKIVSPSASPSGSKLAYFSYSNKNIPYANTLEIIDIKKNKLIFNIDFNNSLSTMAPIWSPDEKKVVYGLLDSTKGKINYFTTEIFTTKSSSLDFPIESIFPISFSINKKYMFCGQKNSSVGGMAPLRETYSIFVYDMEDSHLFNVVSDKTGGFISEIQNCFY